MNNDTAIEVLLKSLDDSFTLARHANDQRATMSNFLITIAAVMFAFISQQGFTRNTVPLGLFMVFLGLFGLLMSVKYEQHRHRHSSRVMLIRQRIAELCPESQILKIEEESSEANRRRYPFLSQRIPILYLWLALHFVICFAGILSTILALL